MQTSVFHFLRAHIKKPLCKHKCLLCRHCYSFMCKGTFDCLEAELEGCALLNLVHKLNP